MAQDSKTQSKLKYMIFLIDQCSPKLSEPASQAVGVAASVSCTSTCTCTQTYSVWHCGPAPLEDNMNSQHGGTPLLLDPVCERQAVQKIITAWVLQDVQIERHQFWS